MIGRNRDFGSDRLTPPGARRRDEMLRELQAAMPRIHRARRRRRAALGGALMIAAAGATAIVALPRRPQPPAPVARTTPTHPDTPGEATHTTGALRSVLVFDYVAPSPHVVDRTAARGTGVIEFVDDRGLVAVLAAMNRPAGVVRRGDRVWLTADVVDEL